MSNSSDDRNPVERLAEEFLDRHRRGDHPRISEYVELHPEWAEEIRELFPTLLMMEGIKPAVGDITGTFMVDRESSESTGIPERLGDFRILREIGRGGMGIVYEAVQESLGRHVALKILLSNALLNERHLLRFLFEAKSAARLHHTHIVPVFGVGESEGHHYYVMQLISGSGLHDVIDELRRVKSAEATTAADPNQTPAWRSLGFAVESIRARAPAPATEVAPVPLVSPSSSKEGTTNSILSELGRNFAKEVARMGLQVAEALAYAHGEGVLHRDIKPANLLLDGKGTVWVADFGLAKAVEGDDLTITGDVVGTIRYMSPERFSGVSGPRSDIYALGLTLYELLTLRPAFDAHDRASLIRQVTSEIPPRPRSINPQIPRDLETIILKAIEHEPARRYRDAEDLAADLQRFLTDLPIEARRVGLIERGWMWAQRKPAIASLVAALTIALTLGFAGTTWQWRQAVEASRIAQSNEIDARTNFAHAMETVNRFCTLVSEEELLNRPGMQPLRRQLLGLAMTYYQTFQKQASDDPEVRRALGLSYIRGGVIASELGDAVGAYRDMLKGRDVFLSLHREHPKDPDLIVMLIRSCIELQDADRHNDFAYSAIVESKVLRRPEILLESIVKTYPENLEYRRVLGRCHDSNAVLYLRRCQFTEAEASIRKAIVLLESVHETDPNDHEAARWLAIACLDAGTLAWRTGHCDERARMLERTKSILETVERRSPTTRRYRLDLAEALVSLGNAYLDLGRYLEAESRFRDALARLDRLTLEDPQAADVRYWLAVAKEGRGRVALERGRTTAADQLREAITLHENAPPESQNERDRLALASSYLALGQTELDAGHRQAIPALQQRLSVLLDELKGRFSIGITKPQQLRDHAWIEARARSQLAMARAIDLPARIAAQEQEVKARRDLVAKYPTNLAHQSDAAAEVIRLASLLREGGQTDRARESITLAFTLLGDPANDGPTDLRHRHDRALAWETLARIESRPGNEIDQAVALLKSLADVEPAYAYDLATALSFRSALTHGEPDAEAAVVALKRACADGFDDDRRLQTDPRLDPLRSRADFLALVGSTRPRGGD